MRSIGALLFFLPFTSAFLAPTASLPRSGRATSPFVGGVQASSQQQQRRHARSSLTMVEQDIIYGGLVAVAGLAVGAGMVALTEQAGVRSEERGALSYEVSFGGQGVLLRFVSPIFVFDVLLILSNSQLSTAVLRSSNTRTHLYPQTKEPWMNWQ